MTALPLKELPPRKVYQTKRDNSAICLQAHSEKGSVLKRKNLLPRVGVYDNKQEVTKTIFFVKIAGKMPNVLISF